MDVMEQVNIILAVIFLVYVLSLGIRSFRGDKTNIFSMQAETLYVEMVAHREQTAEMKKARDEAMVAGESGDEKLLFGKIKYKWFLLSIAITVEFVQLLQMSFSDNVPWPITITTSFAYVALVIKGVTLLLIFICACAVYLVSFSVFAVNEYDESWLSCQKTNRNKVGDVAVESGNGKEEAASLVQDAAPSSTSSPAVGRAHESPSGSSLAPGSSTMGSRNVTPNLSGTPVASLAQGHDVEESEPVDIGDDANGQDEDAQVVPRCCRGARCMAIRNRWQGVKTRVYHFVGVILFDLTFLPALKVSFAMLTCHEATPTYPYRYMIGFPLIHCWQTGHLALVVFSFLMVLILYPAGLKYNLAKNSLDPDFRYLPRFNVARCMIKVSCAIVTTLLAVPSLSWVTVSITLLLMGSLFVGNTYLQPCLGDGAIVNHLRAASFGAVTWAALMAVVALIINDQTSYWPSIVAALGLVPAGIVGWFMSKARSRSITKALIKRVARLKPDTPAEQAAATLDEVANLALAVRFRGVIVQANCLPAIASMVTSENHDVRIAALRCVSNFSMDEVGRKQFSELDIVTLLLQNLETAPADIQMLTFRTLFNVILYQPNLDKLLTSRAGEVCNKILDGWYQYRSVETQVALLAIRVEAFLASQVELKGKLIDSHSKIIFRMVEQNLSDPDTVRICAQWISTVGSFGPEGNRLKMSNLKYPELLESMIFGMKSYAARIASMRALANLCTNGAARSRVTLKMKRFLKRIVSNHNDDALRYAAARILDKFKIKHGIDPALYRKGSPGDSTDLSSVSSSAGRSNQTFNG